jgi:hypothetical protein
MDVNSSVAYTIWLLLMLSVVNKQLRAASKHIVVVEAASVHEAGVWSD